MVLLTGNAPLFGGAFLGSLRSRIGHSAGLGVRLVAAEAGMPRRLYGGGHE